MKRVLKTGILTILMLSMAVSLSACEGKEVLSKDSDIVEEGVVEEDEEEETESETETETEININDINIDWSRLTGYAFKDIDANPNMVDDSAAVFVVNIPDDMANLYYLDDPTYKGHQNVRVMRYGEPVTEEAKTGDYYIRVVRTSNRIVFETEYKLDGSLDMADYSIQAPDGQEYFINWQFTNDVEFIEKELDIYKTNSNGFIWYPSRDFATKRPNELVWDLKYMDVDVECDDWLPSVSSPPQKIVAIDGMEITMAYAVKPSYKIGYDEMSWTLSIRVPEGASEDEFLEELDDIGLYMEIILNDADISRRHITIHEGHNPNYYNDRMYAGNEKWEKLKE